MLNKGACCSISGPSDRVMSPAPPQIVQGIGGTARDDGAKMFSQMLSTLNTLTLQQQAMRDQISEVSRMMTSSSERQETMRQELLSAVQNLSVLPTSGANDTADGVIALQNEEVKDVNDDLEMTKKILQDSARTGSQMSHEPTLLGQDHMPEAVAKEIRASQTKNKKPPMNKNGSASVLGLRGSSSDIDDVDKGRHESVRWLTRVVRHDRFEMAMTLVILANAFVLIFVSQYTGLQVGFDLRYRGCAAEAKDLWPGAEFAFELLDWVFGIIFCLEFMVKILVFKSKYFIDGCHACFNWLDFFCVLAFVVGKIARAFVPVNAQAMRLLRILRLVRLIRILRSLEALDVLYIMATAIKGMGKILAWAIVLLSLLLMSCALALTQYLHSYYFDGISYATLSDPELRDYAKVYEYFGTFTRCLLSFWELTMANWPPATRILAEQVSEYFMAIGVIYKLTIGFAVMGVINGVILQETFKVAATDDYIMVRQKKRAGQVSRDKMTDLFMALDESGDGSLEYPEFEIIAQNPDVKTWLASMDIETDDLHTLFKLIDFDGSGSITVEELIARIPRIKGAARSIDVLAMRTTVNELIQKLTGSNLKQAVPLGGSYKVVPDVHDLGKSLDRSSNLLLCCGSQPGQF